MLLQIKKMISFGFIITRHVNSDITNNYWNCCVQCIRNYYPLQKIIIIDDNSNPIYLKSEREYEKVEIIQSEYPGRGELLPYYYMIKLKFFNNAVILHDSVFFHRKINFEYLIGKAKVLSLWHFNLDTENVNNSVRIATALQNTPILLRNLTSTSINLNVKKKKACFGCQCFINLKFLLDLEKKYSITEMLTTVRNRQDRCSLERILGIIFEMESANQKVRIESVFGNIFNHPHFNKYKYLNYLYDKANNKLPVSVIKVWTGR